MTVLSSGADLHYLKDKRYIGDNVWYHDFDKILTGMRPLMKDFPPAPSHTQWTNWGYVHAPKRPDMAYSMEDDFYLALYGAWPDPVDDEKYTNFVTERMRALAPFSTGSQLADCNLMNRPARFMSEKNLKRLDKLRAKWDPDGVFPDYFGRP